MEERATIPTNTNNTNPDPDHEVIVQVQQPNLPAFMSATYVVQVPKDQIYRVPPPENALIAERHRNNPGDNNNNNNNNTNKRCCSRSLCWLISFVALVLVLGLIACIVYVFLIKERIEPKHYI